MSVKRSTWFAILALIVASAGTGQPRPARAQIAIPNTLPNLIFVLTDDQRFDQMSVMPATIENFNVEFSNAFVSTPLCCPSRATFLTGEYAHNHNVWTNYDYAEFFQPREADSLGPWLQAQGYFTGFFGKYLNRYAVDDPTPPGWDEFYARVGDEGGKLVYNGYTRANIREHYRQGLGSQDRIARYPDREYPDFYMTDYLADQAVRFIDRAEDLNYNPLAKPWALVVWANAPHLPTIAAKKYWGAPVPPFVPAPSFLERDMRDKPAEVRADTYRYLDPAYHRKTHYGMLRMLLSVDDMVEEIFDAVDEHGVRSRTRGLFASDNGWFLGEHRKHEKVYAYEEAAHVPFRMFIPGARRMKIDSLVSSVDAAPTLMALAGDRSLHHFRGKSLLPLISGSVSSLRDSVLIEARSRLRYDAVRTEQWKYIRWESGSLELYDLSSDPYEMVNLAPYYPEIVAEMQQKLDRLKEA
ncbi:MAG: sulfatase-like hydrolase/transferase [Actinobacteria bacterium]|nr:sulfatase-like hydrolase/transferase [Actinomycetota bacterium]